MIEENLAALVEAMLFAAGEPVEITRLAEASGYEPGQISVALKTLAERMEQSGSGLRVYCLEGRYQLATRQEFSVPVTALLQTKKNAPLSQAAMEVLAILAYHQPVSRGYIEQVRGTDSSSTVASLVSRGLVEEAGRLNDLPGHPIVFRTTDAFLRCFGLRSLEDLPPLDELSREQLRFENPETSPVVGGGEP